MRCWAVLARSRPRSCRRSSQRGEATKFRRRPAELCSHCHDQGIPHPPNPSPPHTPTPPHHYLPPPSPLVPVYPRVWSRAARARSLPSAGFATVRAVTAATSAARARSLLSAARPRAQSRTCSKNFDAAPSASGGGELGLAVQLPFPPPCAGKRPTPLLSEI